MKSLYPPLAAYKTEFLDVGSGHSLYLEQSGNPQGTPVIYLHGGPGGRSKPTARQFFDPDKYRIILFDQRGCGQSRYLDPVRDNTTQFLIKDIESIRKHLGIKKWHVYGGSWGSTLALAYSESQPDHVLSIHLRGIYTGTRKEDEWLFNWGANQLFPDKFQELEDFLKKQQKPVSFDSLYDLIFSSDRELAYQAARVSDKWEGSIMKLFPLEESEFQYGNSEEEQQQLLDSKKVMFHYVKNDAFMKPGQLIENVNTLREIPAVIIQGRYDIVCPFITAWKLHLVWPEAAFEIVPDAGHHHSEPGITELIIKYTDKFAAL